jgi:DNA-binding winged helix-turn-helix (wHTH) protein/pimeloyl-ACP methyl ester carboxylesterase
LQFHFEDQLIDVDRRELTRGGGLVAIEPQVFDLLVYLIKNRDRVVSKDDLIASVWRGRIVSESTLTSRINAARKALGDSGDKQRLIRTIARKGIRFVGDLSGDASRPPASKSALHQQVQFCTAPDGVRIAYAEVGQGPPLVRTGHWLTHLEYDWESPVWRSFLHTLAGEHRLIRYDARGTGLSDWQVDEISFDAFVRDLETVVEATGVETFDLLGMSQGAAAAIAYAVQYPHRVRHLVLYGGFSRGRRMRGSEEEIARTEAIATLMRQGWGQENPAFRQLFTSMFIPGANADQMQWFNDLQKMTTSPENAVRLRHVSDIIEVSDLLPRVRTPTLVMHCRDDAVQPFDEGRRLAAGIPGARFVGLEGRNHVILPGDPSWNRFFDEIREFIHQ